MMIFNTVPEAEEHAAYMVATFWLKSADAIIARGENPRKLTHCGYSLVQDEMDRTIYDTRLGGRRNALRRQMESTRIRSLAIDIAMGKLLAGQFPRVGQHFSVCVTDMDSARRFSTALANTGEAK